MVSRGTTLTVTLTGDASQLKRVLGGADRDMQNLERASGRASSSVIGSMSGMALGVGAATASLAGAIAVAKGFADAASDLQETQGKLNIVFGDSAGLFNAWGEGAARSLGMSKQAALESAATVGNFAQALGVSRDSSVEMSKSVVQLAADLASFNNASPEETLTALRAGLSGEAEPLRRFGVAINAAAVENRALAMGLAQTKDELTEGAKVQARYALIMEQTKTAQGNFALTARDSANAARTFRAQVEDLRAEFGTQLLPIQREVLNSTNDLIALHGAQWAQDFATGVEALALAFQGVVAGIGTVDGALRDLTSLGIPDWMKLFVGAVLPGSQFVGGAAGNLWDRAEQQQLKRLEGSRAAGLSDLEVGDAWTGIAKGAEIPAAVLPEVAEGLERVGGGAKSLANEDLKLLQGALTTLNTEMNASADATMRMVEAEARLGQERQRWYGDYLRQLGQQNTRFAPGVFEGLARQAGLTPIGEFTNITQTDLATGITTPVDVVVP